MSIYFFGLLLRAKRARHTASRYFFFSAPLFLAENLFHHPLVCVCSYILPITPVFYLRKNIPVCLSNSLLDVPRVLFQKVANTAFDLPNVPEGDSSKVFILFTSGRIRILVLFLPPTWSESICRGTKEAPALKSFRHILFLFLRRQNLVVIPHFE